MKDSFQTERLTLRHLGPAMAREITSYQVRNRKFFAPWSPLRKDEFFSLRSQINRIREEEQLRQRGRFFRFYIFANSDRDIVGDFTVSNIVRGSFCSCNLGYQLDEQQTGNGYITEAVRQGISFAFTQLKLHRVEANVMPNNLRSINVVKRLGLRHEGTAEKFLLINGSWEDHLRFAVVKEEWTDS